MRGRPWRTVDLRVVVGTVGGSALEVYNTRFHDLHHLKFSVNYAFPFPAMDVVHGTFRAEERQRQQQQRRAGVKG